MNNGGENLVITFDGLPEDQGNFRLRSFAKKLDDLKDALRLAGNSIGAPAAQDYLIVGLERNSPPAMEAEPLDKDWGADAALALVDCIASLRIATSYPKGLSDELFEATKRLLGGVGKSFSALRLSYGEQRQAAVDGTLAEAVARLERLDVASYGSIKGAIERFNSHASASYFYIYTRDGKGVKCDFGQELLADAADAVAKSATVTGLLKYHPGSWKPYSCAVQSIHLHKEDSELPSMESLYGVAPELSGKTDTLSFIRNLRQDWHG